MRYDLHTHTMYSGCSNLSPKRLLKAAYKKGLDGIAVTDHNSIRGALEAKKLNTKPGFEVVIGEEIKTDKGEVIGLYLKKAIKSRKFHEVRKEIKKQGGLIIIPHPYDIGVIRFRIKLKIEDIRKNIDALETLNARCFFKFLNLKSQIKAAELNIAQTGGSDAHFASEVGKAYTEFKGRLRSAIKNKTTKARGRIGFALPARLLSGVIRFIIKPLLPRRK